MIKRLTFLVFVLSSFLSSYSQSRLTVVDSLTNTPLPFVAVLMDTSGSYCNEYGQFNEEILDSKEFTFQLLGYKTRTIKKKHLKDTIKLIPDYTELKEVILNYSSSKELWINPLNSPRNFTSWVLMPKTEIVTIIDPGIEMVSSKVQKIYCNFRKIKEKKREWSELKNIKAVLRWNLYEVDKNKLLKKILSSEAMLIENYNSDKLEWDLPYLFPISENSIAIGIEMLGYYDINSSSFVDLKDGFVRPNLIKKVHDQYDQNTFIKYSFKEESRTVPINNYFTNNNNRNLSLGLKLLLSK